LPEKKFWVGGWASFPAPPIVARWVYIYIKLVKTSPDPKKLSWARPEPNPHAWVWAQ